MIDKCPECAARSVDPKAKNQPLGMPKRVGPTDWPKWGILIETDEEFAARAGRQVVEVTE